MSAGAQSARRLLIFVVAFNAEATIEKVLRRIPREIADLGAEVLIVDDASEDATFERAHSAIGGLPFPVTVLLNPENQGYGGNQKLGFHYAIENGFDFVALMHGEGAYAPECLPELIRPLADGEADAVLGSRMMTPAEARQEMPLDKRIGNRLLTAFENRMLHTRMSELHSGYRLYSVAALQRIPFRRNTNDFHFDTEVLIQLLRSGARVVERPIPVYRGEGFGYVEGLRYAWNVARTAALARAREYGLFYDPKFDLAPTGDPYVAKLDYPSSHSYAIDAVAPNTRVLDLGCGAGHLVEALAAKGCRVVGVDRRSPAALHAAFERFVVHDLDDEPLPLTLEGFDRVLLLDIVEHLRSPERFVELLAEAAVRAPQATLVVTSPNIGFFVSRLMLLLGQFNYGKRGILDMTHTRLFTFRSLRALFEQGGFEVREMRGVPPPFPLALGAGRLSSISFRLADLGMRVSKSLFAYQIFLVARPRPSLELLLDRASTASAQRSRAS